MSSILRPICDHLHSLITRSYKVSVLGHGPFNPNRIITCLKEIRSVTDVSVHNQFLLKDIHENVTKFNGNAIVNLFDNDRDIGKCLRSSDVVLILANNVSVKDEKEGLQDRLSFFSRSITQTCKSALICVQLQGSSSEIMTVIAKELKRFGGLDERKIIGVTGNMEDFVHSLLNDNLEEREHYKDKFITLESGFGGGTIDVKEVTEGEINVMMKAKDSLSL